MKILSSYNFIIQIIFTMEILQLIYIEKLMQQSNDFVSRTIKTQKLFRFDRGNCNYANVESMRKTDKSGQDSKIRITNNLCRENGHYLIKITEVRFQNRVIYIQDTYSFETDATKENVFADRSFEVPTTSRSGSNTVDQKQLSNNNQNQIMTRKKKFIFKKKIINDGIDHKPEKRNTKNVAKNFCKAFISYLDDKNQKVGSIRAKQLISKYNYNNRVIEKMANDDLVNAHFKDFLKNKALQWINSSKIFSKQIHVEAINLYLELIQKPLNSHRGNSQIIHEQSNSIQSSNQVYDESENYSIKESQVK